MIYMVEIKAKNNIGEYRPITATAVKGGTDSQYKEYKGRNYLHTDTLFKAMSRNTETNYNLSIASTTGTVGVATLDIMCVVLNSTLTGVGSKDDSSLTITSTALTKEVDFIPGKKLADYDNYLSNGDYAVDYTTGTIIYKTADSSGSATATYTYVIPKVDTEINDANVKIDNIVANPEYKGYKVYEGSLTADVEFNVASDLGDAGRTGYIYNASSSELSVQIDSTGAYGDTFTIPAKTPFEIGGLKTNKIKLIYNSSSSQDYKIFVAKAE